jgi:hypothetical protein
VSTAAIVVTLRKLIVARGGGIAGTAAEDLHLDI